MSKTVNLNNARFALNNAARVLRLAGVTGIDNALQVLNDQIDAASIDPNGPLSDDQRRALFATFSDVFGQNGSAQRYAFTRLALGKPADAVVSWSRHKPGALTYAEASKVLDALNVLDV